MLHFENLIIRKKYMRNIRRLLFVQVACFYLRLKIKRFTWNFYWIEKKLHFENSIRKRFYINGATFFYIMQFTFEFVKKSTYSV